MKTLVYAVTFIIRVHSPVYSSTNREHLFFISLHLESYIQVYILRVLVQRTGSTTQSHYVGIQKLFGLEPTLSSVDPSGFHADATLSKNSYI